MDPWVIERKTSYLVLIHSKPVIYKAKKNWEQDNNYIENDFKSSVGPERTVEVILLKVVPLGSLLFYGDLHFFHALKILIWAGNFNLKVLMNVCRSDIFQHTEISKI
jgi:hypothetical protein